jgi:hypothetical protein
LAQPQGLEELLEQNLSRMHGCKSLRHVFS